MASLAVGGHGVFWLAMLVSLILIPIGLPGTWVMVVLAAIFGVIEGFQDITVWGILGLAAAAGFGELVEFAGGTLGAKFGGASREGMIAATIGGILGAIFGTALIPIPIVGSILGAFILCFALTAAIEYNRESNFRLAMKAGFGAFFGKIFSTIAKISIGAGMMAWVAYRIYFHG